MPVFLPIILLAFIFIFIFYVYNGKKKTKESNTQLDIITTYYHLLQSDILFDVDNFNGWFNAPKPDETYANAGIFLRLDKLSHEHFILYINSFGLEPDLSAEFYHDNRKAFVKFEKKVRADWVKRKQQNEL